MLYKRPQAVTVSRDQDTLARRRQVGAQGVLDPRRRHEVRLGDPVLPVVEGHAGKEHLGHAAAIEFVESSILHRLHQLSIWDALIVRAALATGCRVLFTEDLQHGRRLDGLEIVNPFLGG